MEQRLGITRADNKIMLITLEHLRRFTVARNFLKPTTLKRALHRISFVQADPIRSPARAQDLILRHRVKNYHAGDLERLYATLDIEEDFFVVYGFVTRSLHELMHPRGKDVREENGKGEMRKTQLLLEFVRERGAVHPREVDEHFSHGTVKNYWGGSSNATTDLLDAMHYRGLLRVQRREKGIRIYSAREYELPTQSGRDAWAPRATRIDALVDVAVRLYAPLPGPSLSSLVSRLRFAVPQWKAELKSALQRAKERLSYARVDGVDWYWPAGFQASGFKSQVSSLSSRVRLEIKQHPPEERVHLLAPFDPVVRDRHRFRLLWGWEYRFEAYTPARKRKLGYYAMPLLWRDRVIGWGNLSVKNGELNSEFGYVGTQPRDRAFKRELEAELDRMRGFLDLES
jgi:uncharacterized protein YcaQ